MSTEITTAFVDTFRPSVLHLANQKESRLRNFVDLETLPNGDRHYFERMSAPQDTASLRTSRHGDTPQVDTPHSRRALDPEVYEHADLIDIGDDKRTAIAAANNYAMLFGEMFGRTMDKVIIDAALGSANTGHDGSTAVALPAAQQISASATDLTVAKLRSAKDILGDNEADEDLHIACTQSQITNLLTETEITSSDYNTVKALVQGEVDTFMGFRFHRIKASLISTDGSGDRQVVAWSRRGIKLGVNEAPTIRVSERADKSYSQQVYMRMDIGAVRMEEERVVEIACTEA